MDDNALAEVRKAMEERDRRDSTRDHSPLRPAPDAEAIDSTEMSADEVVQQIRRILAARP